MGRSENICDNYDKWTCSNFESCGEIGDMETVGRVVHAKAEGGS